LKISELISRTVLKPIPKGRNLDQIGWCDGYLLVQFKGRATKYIYGPAIAEVECDKIAGNPFPDVLFTKLRKKYHWQMAKVG
jgi:hypothetical protein